MDPGTPRIRAMQLQHAAAALSDAPKVLLAGDWNTNTLNSETIRCADISRNCRCKKTPLIRDRESLPISCRAAPPIFIPWTDSAKRVFGTHGLGLAMFVLAGHPLVPPVIPTG